MSLRLEDFRNGTYKVGAVMGVASATYESGVTSPPERYTQSSLIDDMMAAHKFAKSDGEREILKQIAGLGTARTREPTVTNLIERGFLEVVRSRTSKKQYLKPTAVAKAIAEHLPAELTSVATTAKWELAFRMIEQGKATPDDVFRHLRQTLQELVADAKSKRGQNFMGQASTANLKSAPPGRRAA